MVKFGTFVFPHALEVQESSAHEEIERTIPMANVAYRADRAELGRTIRITGEIREASADTVRETIDEMRSLVDGTKRSLDLEDGTTPFNALLADPEYTVDMSEGWFENSRFSANGRFYVPYSATLLEVTAP